MLHMMPISIKTSIDLNQCLVLGKPFYEYNSQIISNASTDTIDWMETDEKEANFLIDALEEDSLIMAFPKHLLFLDVTDLQKLLNKQKEKKQNVTIGIFRSSSIAECDIVRNHASSLWGHYVLCCSVKVLKRVLPKIDHKTNIIQALSGVAKLHYVFIKAMEIEDLYQLSLAEDEISTRILQNLMLKGVRIESPKTVQIGPDVMCEKGAIIKKGTIIKGKSFIKSFATIGPYTELNNTVVYENAVVQHSVVLDSVIRRGATIGPYAHIRNGSDIGEENRIGNFVEIKKTTTGRKTNAAHLSYLGDTVCGSGVNWGCGTITVNYDGKNKNITNVGDNVFIGCNSNLIAPIEIESNTYIAAGSTITKNLKAYDFSIARADQMIKPFYAKKYNYKKVDKE